MVTHWLQDDEEDDGEEEEEYESEETAPKGKFLLLFKSRAKIEPEKVRLDPNKLLGEVRFRFYY